MTKPRMRFGGGGASASVGIAIVALVAGLGFAAGRGQGGAAPAHARAVGVCKGDNGGLSLAPGFCATVFADNVGHARQMVVDPDGTLYANTWSGRYFKNVPPPPGGYIVAMRDTNGDGKADSVERFGETPEAGATGGSGIALYKGAIYAEENSRILRYPLGGKTVAAGKGEVVVSGLPLTGDHPMHPITISPKGELFVDLGSATNACEVKNRQPLSPGVNPCTEKEMRAGIWMYDANKTNQPFSPKERYATGIRNGEGLAWDSAGRLYVTQHGRDQLGQNWKQYYTLQQGEDLPAEQMMELVKGADYGWPECYFDGKQNKLVLAPEYGGDGGKTVGLCAQRKAPVAAFPAHWAPNSMAINNGSKWPAGYRGGAFIAFHGSWNRAPGPQGGFNIVFQPLSNGKAAGHYTIFADGFAGPDNSTGKAVYRPTGVAFGPDGALYVSDDVKGRIWRITYNGNGSDAVASAPKPQFASTNDAGATPPEGTHPDAGRSTPALPVPPGGTADQVALGNRIFHGEASGGTCSGCHGSNGTGGAVGPALNDGKFVWSDGSPAGIAATIRKGVAQPKNYPGGMPPLGGSPLGDKDVDAVAAYIWALSHAQSH